MNIRKLIYFTIIIFTFMLLGCNKSQDDLSDLEQVQNTIDMFVKAMNANDIDKLIEFYTENAIQMPPGQNMLRGKQAIKEEWERLNSTNVELIMDTIEMTRSDDFVYQVNKVTFKWQVKDQDSVFTTQDKNVLIWKKQSDNTWKLHIDIWNSCETSAVE